MTSTSSGGSYVDGSAFVRLFGKPSRAAILDVFLGKPHTELSISEIADLADIDQSTVSRNISFLENIGMIENTRQVGNAGVYQLNKNHPLTKALGKFHHELLYHVEDIDDYSEMEIDGEESSTRVVNDSKAFDLTFGGDLSRESLSSEDITVLVVEDQEELADLYGRWIEEEFTAIVAYTAKEALEKFNDDIDVALLDRRLPDISGDHLLGELRNQGWDGPVAMISSVEPDGISELPFDDYIVKPISKEEVLSIVKHLFELYDYREDLRMLLALNSKISALQRSFSEDDLEDNEEYAKLKERYERLHKRTDLQSESPTT